MFEALGGISLDVLRVFEVAARQRSFTAAAVELGTTQPAVSQQIKRLEEQLGARLFDRIYRGIELTEAGVLLYEKYTRACSNSTTAWLRWSVTTSTKYCASPPILPSQRTG